jgi:glycosyltransferase involved in cell wall biosynthesis
MQILYIHQHFCTPRAAGGSRSYEFARRWVKAGHEVTFLAGTGWDPSLPDRGVAEVEGFKVRMLGVRYDNRMSFAKRLMSFVMFAIKSTWHAMFSRKYDVVLATSTPLLVAIPALAAKWIARRPMVFEVRDVWPDAAIDAGVLKSRVLIRLALWLEKRVYRAADVVVPLSVGMQSRIERKRFADTPMVMIPNCCDLARFDDVDREQSRRDQGVADKFVILYIGAISLANDMPFLAQCVERTKDQPNVVWWFIGGGNMLDDLKKRVTEAGATNVKFWGLQPKEATNRLVPAADVGIVSFIPQPVYYENSPNKFFDYSAASLPVIFTRSTWLKPWIDQYDAGFICESNEVDECIGYLDQLREMPEQARRQIGSNARRMAEREFARDSMAERYLTLLQAVVDGDQQAIKRLAKSGQSPCPPEEQHSSVVPT